MPAKKKQLLSNRRRVMKFIVLPLGLVALILLGVFQLVRISSLETMVRDLSMQNSLYMINDYYSPLAIDGPNKQAYIPELSLVLPYDKQLTSTLRYMAYQDDTSTNDGIVQLSTATEIHKTKTTNQGLIWGGCVYAFTLVVGAGEPQADMKLVSQKIIHDGRKVRLYENTTDVCQGFITSADGGTLIDLFQRVESY